MSEETTSKQEMPEQLSDILLVLDKEKMKIQAVKSIDENGKLETVDPTKKNQNQFMRVDKSGDFFSNFFSNFFSQLKEPTNFSFFKVPAPIAVEKAQEMQKQVDKPTPEGEKVMKEHEIKAGAKQHSKQENQKDMATTQLNNRMDVVYMNIEHNGMTHSTAGDYRGKKYIAALQPENGIYVFAVYTTKTISSIDEVFSLLK